MEKKKYFVIIDVRSVIGSIYNVGNNDGYVTDGNLKHPIIDCTEISINSPYYVFVKRDLKRIGKNFQSLYIPHSSIVAIYEYNVKDSKPIGFVFESDTKK